MKVLDFDRETCLDLLETFVQQTREGLVFVSAALDEGRTKDAEGKLHQLKGAAGAVRQASFRKSFEETEILIRDNDVSGARQTLEGIWAEPLLKM